MSLIKICPNCYRSYPDISLNFCTDDGSILSQPVEIPVAADQSEIETVIRPRFVKTEVDKVRRPKANAKHFIAKNFPELSTYLRRTSRMWEHSERPNYYDNWWFGLMKSDLENHEYVIFAGALDYENKDFKILKVPTRYLSDNMSRLDMTADGWINLYIRMSDLINIRKDSGLPFNQFAQN